MRNSRREHRGRLRYTMYDRDRVAAPRSLGAGDLKVRPPFTRATNPESTRCSESAAAHSTG